MAEEGRREVVSDPLAFNPRAQGADRSLPTYGVRNPMQTAGDAAFDQARSSLGILDGLQAALGRAVEAGIDTSITEGKLKFMQGATEEEIIKSGDKYSVRGWQSMNSVDKASRWFTEEAQFIEGDGQALTPDEYRKRLMESRKAKLDSLPDDPAIRKAYVAAFEDYGPRLMSEHVIKHNEYNTAKGVSEFSSALDSYSGAAPDKSMDADDGFRISSAQVSEPITYNDSDRDTAIRTMLGEASGEGATGMAAVAHVMINRTRDRRYGGSVKDVALAPDQFSVWNDGGEKMMRYSPDTAAYRKAGEIFDAVAQGFHVDPTGGATHYFAPQGMKDGKEPDWFADESARAGGAIKLGNHVFAGKSASRGSDGLRVASISGLNWDKRQIKEVKGLAIHHTGGRGTPDDVVRTLNERGFGVQYIMDRDGTIYQATPDGARVAHIKNAQNASGLSNDNTLGIEIIAKDDNDLTPEQIAAGAKWINQMRDKHPGIGENVFGHGQLNDHKHPNEGMSVINAWRKGADSGSTSSEPSGRSSRVQNFIRNSPLKSQHKATAVADAMRRSFERGDDTLFNDAGGIAVLHGLGAKPSEIDEVLKAKERFDAEKEKKFDVKYEKERADILSRVQSGEFGTVDAALAAVDEFHNKYGGSEAEAKSLARQVAADWEKAGSEIVPLELRNKAASLYDQIENGALTPDEAGQQIIDYSKANGIKESVANNFIASMYTTDKARKDRVRTEAAAEVKRQEKEKQVINQAEQALAKGYGLKGLTGKVRIPDEANPGMTKEVSGEEFGVWKLKESVRNQYVADIDAKRITPEHATSMMNKDVYEMLAKQQVPDTAFGQQVAAAVAGDFIKDGAPAEGALQAFDWYMQMRNNPSVGTSYLSTMLPENARTLLETAATMYDGRLSVEDALTKAHAVLNDPLDAPAKMEKSAAFYRQVSAGIGKAVNAISNDTSWMQSLLGRSAYRTADVQSAIENDTRAKAYLAGRAETYHLLNPREPTSVSIKKAQDDLANNGILIGSEIVLGNFDRGERLDQKMGIETLGKDAPQKALDEALDNYAPDWWGPLWNDRVKTGIFRDRGEREQGRVQRPPYRVTYLPEQGVMEVELYKDNKRTETIGEPMILDVRKEIGEPYKAKQRVGEQGALGTAWRGFKEAVVDAVQGTPSSNAAEAGSAIGSMFNK